MTLRRLAPSILALLLLSAAAVAQPAEPRRPRNPRWPRERTALAPEGTRVLPDLEYGSVDGRPLRLDLYLPEPAGEARRPLVVWVHGGGWRGGDKTRTRAARLAARGYAVASVEYRLSGEAIFPAQIHDCKAAIRWLRANAARYRIDPDRIGVWGSSAGGHLAALLGTSGDVVALEGLSNGVRASSRVQAVCDFYGPSDLGALLLERGDRNRARSPESLLLGGLPEEKRDLAALASPVTHATADDPPFLIVHGDQDRTVPLSQSTRLLEALHAAKVSSALHVVKGGGHGFRDAEVDRLVDAFFDRHLGPVPPAAGRTSEPSWQRRSFASRLLERSVPYHVHLPAGYEGSDRRYPVVYWLHGLNGRSSGGQVFVRHVDAHVRAGRLDPVIVVGVDGGRASMYCDAVGGEPRESVIVRELIPHVDATYRTVASRAGRAVEGFSMGGFGALHLAFKHPDLFVAATSLSGALRDPRSFRNGRSAILRDVFDGDLEAFARESPQALAAENVDRLRGRLRIRLAVGERDGLRETMWGMHEVLRELRLAHEVVLLANAGHASAEVYAGLGDRTARFYREVFGAAGD